jgi:hypothetical protein
MPCIFYPDPKVSYCLQVVSEKRPASHLIVHLLQKSVLDIVSSRIRCHRVRGDRVESPTSKM